MRGCHTAGEVEANWDVEGLGRRIVGVALEAAGSAVAAGRTVMVLLDSAVERVDRILLLAIGAGEVDWQLDTAADAADLAADIETDPEVGSSD